MFTELKMAPEGFELRRLLELPGSSELYQSPGPLGLQEVKGSEDLDETLGFSWALEVDLHLGYLLRYPHLIKHRRWFPFKCRQECHR